MTYADTFENSATYLLDKCANAILDKNDPNITQRQQAGKFYLQAFERAAISNDTLLHLAIPAYKIHLNRFLSLVENPREHRRVRADVLRYPIHCTIMQLHASAEWEMVYNDIRHTFSRTAQIPQTAVRHLDFPELLERLITIAETPTQSAEIRQEAISTFNDLANNAVTTFGQTVVRANYNDRFSKIAASTKDRSLIEAAMHIGYR